MTTRDERTRSLIWAEKFLREVAAGMDSDVAKEQARRILRHHPSTYELLLLAKVEEESVGRVLAPPLLCSKTLEAVMAARTAERDALLGRVTVTLSGKSSV